MDLDHRYPAKWMFQAGGSVEEWYNPSSSKDPLAPEVDGSEFFLLAVALQMERRGRKRLEWTELRDHLTCSYGRRQEAMENLQKKGLIKKVGEKEGDKYYRITDAGRQLILGQKFKIVNNAVKNGPMKEKHAKVMKKVIEDRVLHLEHVWVDPHMVSDGEGGPDLVVTPVAWVGSFEISYQYAVEVTKNPDRDQSRLVNHFGYNRDRRWPTLFVPVYEEHVQDIERAIEKRFPNAVPCLSEKSFFKGPFSYDIFGIETKFSLQKVKDSKLPTLREMLEHDREIIEMRRKELEKPSKDRTPVQVNEKGQLEAHELEIEMEGVSIPIFYGRSGTGDDREYHGRTTALSKEAAEAETEEELNRLTDTLEEWEEKVKEAIRSRSVKEKLRRAIKRGGKPYIKKRMVWVGEEPICEYSEEARNALFELLDWQRG